MLSLTRFKSYTAIERSDVCILIIDATEGVTEQDARIVGEAHEQGKGLIIAVNKWDLVEKSNKTNLVFEKKIREVLSFVTYAPIVFISAKTGQRVNKIFAQINNVYTNCTNRVKTGVLNDIINEAVILNQPPTDKGRRLKIYYGTQVGIKPPKFVIFINDKKLLHFSYTRYLENQFRQNFGFEGTPIRIEFNERRG